MVLIRLVGPQAANAAPPTKQAAKRPTNSALFVILLSFQCSLKIFTASITPTYCVLVFKKCCLFY